MVLHAIQTDSVWITTDKDVLPEHEALTNWDQGPVPLADLWAMLQATGDRKRILGADICGGYSPLHRANWLKRLESRIDQSAHNVTDRQRIDDNTHIDCELARVLFDACTSNFPT